MLLYTFNACKQVQEFLEDAFLELTLSDYHGWEPAFKDNFGNTGVSNPD